MLCCLYTSAQHRSESEAMQIAKDFFGKKGSAPQLSLVPQQKLAAKMRSRALSGKTIAQPSNDGFYVVNDETNNRFVIVSADERMYKILGYSYNGQFDEEIAPAGLLEMMETYNRQYNALIDKPEQFESDVYQEEITVEPIEPLIKTKWGQNEPYNNDCPTNRNATDDSKCASGCVATAMAQVMNYYKYPTKGKAKYSYVSGTQSHFQSFNFGITTFYWDNILNEYGNNATEVQKAEVAKLMHACGVSVSMDYGESADGQSGACPSDIPYAMINYFGYNPNTVYKEKDYYTTEEWTNMILQELKASRPILYGGRGGSGGHRFILDGYDGKGLFHFNFGWNGSGDDTYLSLDAIKPKAKIKILDYEFEVGNGDFSNSQSMVYKIYPSEISTSEDVFYTTDFSSSSDKFSTKLGQSVLFSFSATNNSSTTSLYDKTSPKYEGVIGIGLYDSNFNFIKSLTTKGVSSRGRNKEFIWRNVTISANDFKDGNQYYIAPYAKANNHNAPTRIREPFGLGWYLAKVNNGTIELIKNETSDSNPQPIPTGTVYVTVSAQSSSTIDPNAKSTTWQMTLTRDANDPLKYWFDNIDPAVTSGSNRVWGTANESGTQISIPVGQSLGDNLTITNYSNNGDIIVNVSAVDSTMKITEAWGTLQQIQSSEGTTLAQMSLYATTDMSLKPIDVEQVVVSKPLITVDNDKKLNIACSTDGVNIYYTIDYNMAGTDPTTSSSKYSTSVQLDGNCVIRAIAYKDGKQSETAEYTESGFMAEKPQISADGNKITITTGTDGAEIRYTISSNGETPNESSSIYRNPFTVDKDCVIEAIALKSHYTNSEINTLRYVKPDSDPIIVSGNKAGDLLSQIPAEKKLTAKQLAISGELNGTDIALIREMIINGNLNNLDIKNAKIVAGGAPYYIPQYGSDYQYTEDNVIGENMFYNCNKLTSLNLPSSATILKPFSIYRCSSLKSIVIPDSCKTVDKYAIDYCDNLETVNLLKNVMSISGENFDDCKSLKNFTVAEDNDYFRADDGVLYTKDMTKLVMYPIGKVTNEYTLPTSVTTIGENAFRDAKLLKINLPETLTNIENGAFVGCKNIKEIALPDGVKTIDHMAFYRCEGLMSVVLPSSLLEIKRATFEYCSNLREVSIGMHVRSIADNAFDNCPTLQKFNVDENNTKYTSVNGILYSNKMRDLVRCPLALYADELIIPDMVENICDNAFAGCINIGNIRMPDNLRSIGSQAFFNTAINIASIPSGVSSIGSMAFYGCKKLKSVSLQHFIEDIENSTFSGCENLSYVRIPMGIRKVNYGAFSGCKSLATIECWANDIENLVVDYSDYLKDYSPFKDIPDDCTWIVLEGTEETYKSRPWWRSTWKIRAELPVSVKSVTTTSPSVSYSDGVLNISNSQIGIIRIYSVDGVLVKSINAKAGGNYQVSLPEGIYVINGKKFQFRK